MLDRRLGRAAQPDPGKGQGAGQPGGGGEEASASDSQEPPIIGRVADPYKFPEGFLWGTASAAHQVEGDNRNNDWWEWEQTPGHIHGGDSSLVACDHYRRYREDFRLLRELHNNAHRLSVEWSRVEPRPGEFDARQVRHYRDVLAALRENGLEPMVTLHHFTSPTWFTRGGGWTASEAPRVFDRFVRHVVTELGELVDLWCTINEPNIYAFEGWLAGEFPPGRRGDLAGWYRVLSNLSAGHELAYETLHEVQPQARVGLSYHDFPLLPATPHRRDRLAAWLGNAGTRMWPSHGRPRPIVDAACDWIGVAQYHGQLASFDVTRPLEQFVRRENVPGRLVTEMGWSADPEWMHDLLVRVGGAGKPIYITESGISTSDDRVRERYLVEVLRAVGRAIAEGADVRGYFHWTNLDNFEWARGYSQKFGLIGVDRATLEREVKPSGRLYARIAQANAVATTA